jgi:hypothetical protein
MGMSSERHGKLAYISPARRCEYSDNPDKR